MADLERSERLRAWSPKQHATLPRVPFAGAKAGIRPVTISYYGEVAERLTQLSGTIARMPEIAKLSMADLERSERLRAGGPKQRATLPGRLKQCPEEVKRITI